MKTAIGVASTSYMMAWQPQDTLEFLEHCHNLGADGIQAYLTGDPKRLRARAEQYGMYIEAMVRMPQPNEPSVFEKALQDAQAAGAIALRTDLLPTRRYEAFQSYSDWQQHLANCHASIETALPVLDRYRIPLGLENHKDWTADDALALMRRYRTEFFGLCLDFGNNLSLLDDPMDVIAKLASYAVCIHLKDMAVAPSPDGFLLSEVMLGSGYLDLPRAIALVRSAHPQIRLSLEMITRDPLRIPCFSDHYWKTFPDCSATRLARALRFVHQNASKQPLPTVTHLSREDWLKAENDNVIACLCYARERLSL